MDWFKSQTEKISFILKSFKSYLKFNRKILIVIYILTLVLALSQGVSYVLLIPLLQLLDIGSQNQSNLIPEFFRTFNELLHFELSLEFLLVFYFLILWILFYVTTKRNLIHIKYQSQYSGYLRSEIYRKMIFNDWQNLVSKSKHNYLQVLTTEIPKATTFYYNLLNCSTRIILLLVHLTLAFLVSKELTTIILVAGILQFLLLNKFFKKSLEIGMLNRLNFRRLLKYIDEFWITIKTAKIHNSEDFYCNNFSKINMQYVDTQIKETTNTEKPQFFYKMLGLVNLVVVIYISNKIFNTPLELLIVLILLFSKILPLFISTFNDINVLFLNVFSVKNISHIINESKTTPLSTISLEELKLKENITLKNVGFEYANDKKVFTDLNLQIKINSFTGIIGHSGKGKTTLIDLISGLLIPQKGEILFDNTNINNQNSNIIRKQISYLAQDSLFIDGSLKENLLWDTNSTTSDLEILEILEKVNASEILEEKKLNINSEILNYKFSFSGGELQRFAIARALLRKPKILIIDEATSALDEKNEDIIIELLKTLKSNTTILFVTHKKRLISHFDNFVDLEKI